MRPSSRTQFTNLTLLRFISKTDDVLNVYHQHKSERTFDDVVQSRLEGMCTLNITMGQERIAPVQQTQEHERQNTHH